jgi:hypothetical protein
MNATRTDPSMGYCTPLCCGYVFVILESISARIAEANGTQATALHWALGILPTGEHEVLGAWAETNPPESIWNTVLHDLETRGVERVQLAIGGRVIAVADDRSFSGLCPIGWTKEFDGASPARRRRRFWTKTEDTTMELRRKTVRVLSRHGCFANSAEALAVLSKVLERGEREMRARSFRAAFVLQRESMQLRRPSSSVVAQSAA